MYLWTRDGLAQIPTLYGPLAGTLGEPPLPPKIQSFLDRVKRNPHDYEALLLTVTFHVEPFPSDQLRKVLVASLENNAKDPFEEGKAIQAKVLQELVAICKEHLKDNGFSKLFNKEKQLIPVVAKAFQETIKTYEAKGWLERLLVDALRKKDIFGEFEFGKLFALSFLPDEIAEQILNSRVPETHYARLGKALRLMAEQRQKDKPAFKRRVEQERKKQRK
jgi:hypothetical protein